MKTQVSVLHFEQLEKAVAHVLIHEYQTTHLEIGEVDLDLFAD